MVLNMHDSSRLFNCQRCGACCSWPGPVRITDAEVDAIAGVLGIDPREFVAAHATLTSDRRSLTLKEKPDGTCAFLSEGKLCLIEAAKPMQCRDFPSKWRTEDIDEQCPAWRLMTEAQDDEDAARGTD